MDAHGMKRHVSGQHMVAIWKCLSGHVQKDAHGTNRHVLMPLQTAIWKFFSGHMRMDAHGMNRHVWVPLKVAIYTSLSGFVQKDALPRGGRTKIYARLLKNTAIQTSWSGCQQTIWCRGKSVKTRKGKKKV
jgi:hypothetical protein